MYKKAWYSCKVVVLLIELNLLLFRRSRCRSRRSLVRSLFYFLLPLRMFKCRIIISSSGLVSIRVSNPWVMGWACWCTCAHQPLSVGIVTFFALASGAGRRGWSVAFPGFKVFDLVQRCWVLDPLKTLGNCHDPNVPHRGQFAKEGLCSFRNNNNKHKKSVPMKLN